MAEDSAALGRALKKERLARGMTQRALGAPTHSASFVSLAEAGRRRMGAETLRLFCERLGTTVQELSGEAGAAAPRTHDEVALDLAWAKIAIRAGNPASAEKYARIVLDDPTLGEHDRLDALSLLAAATEGQGRFEDALTILENLSAELDADRTHGLWLSAQVMRMRCYQRVGDVDLAIEIGTAALDRFGPTFDDEEAVLVVSLAQAHRQRGDLVRARMLLSNVLSRADSASRGRARGSALWNASLVAADEGRMHDAARLSEQALALLSESDATRNLARLHANCADILMERGDAEAVVAARGHLDVAMEGLELEGDVAERAGLLAELARCDLWEGRLDDAERRLLDARLLLDDVAEGVEIERSWVEMLEGHVLVARGQESAGLLRCRQAALVAERCESGAEASRAWKSVAELARRTGDQQVLLEALDRSVSLAGVRPTVTGWSADRAPRPESEDAGTADVTVSSSPT